MVGFGGMDIQNTILVVDDEAGMREFLAAFFRACEIPVLTAASAEDALHLWETKATEIKVVVTDIVMPGMNGKALAERLRADRPKLKIIFMSGYLPAEIAEEALDGVFFAKPFNPSDLLAAVQTES
jgi:two-component system, cell cycle sensor histidine kinase and response regulator CckA